VTTTVESTIDLAREARRENGRFAGHRNPFELYEIVRVVAEIAAARDEDRYKDPATVTHAAFNSARRAHEPEVGAIPQANEICRQLADFDGAPYPWGELLALIFDPTRNIKKTHEQRLSEPDRTLTEKHVVYAMFRVASSLGVTTVLPREYDDARDRLLEKARDDGMELAIRRVLPSRHQLESACGGSWDRVLEVAGLSPRVLSAPPAPQGLPIVDALVAFYCGRGYLPTQRELEEAGRLGGYAYGGRKGRTWPILLEEARNQIAALGLPAPPPYGKTQAAEDWEPLTLGLAEAPARNIYRYSRVEVVEAVRRFVPTLDGASPTHGRWRSFSNGKHGTPSLTVIIEHGGIVKLMREASRPDWRQRAEEWVDPRQRTEETQTAVEAERLRARAMTPRAEEVVGVIGRRGDASAQVIADELGWSIYKVRDCLRLLKDADRVEQTQERAQAKNQTYRIKHSPQTEPSQGPQ
jgi:hypothetical protein